jgi:hypothetical protein
LQKYSSREFFDTPIQSNLGVSTWLMNWDCLHATIEWAFDVLGLLFGVALSSFCLSPNK